MGKFVFIEGLQIGMSVCDFFLVKRAEIRVGSTGRDYLDLILGDKTGDLPAKKWDVGGAYGEFCRGLSAGSIVCAEVTVSEWNGGKQLKVGEIRYAVSGDELKRDDFVAAAPRSSEELYGDILARANSIVDDELRGLCVHFLESNKERLMYYPAAMRNHHAIYGGLLYHTGRMLENGDRVCDTYGELNRDLVATGVIMHDMAKLDEIEANKLGMSDGYFVEGTLLGHIVQGIKAIEIYAASAGMSKEKVMMVQHMVLSHHYEAEYGSPKKPMFPEAEVLHYLDVMDAKLYDMFEALKGVEGGSFSERVRTLDGRQIYKPSF